MRVTLSSIHSTLSKLAGSENLYFYANHPVAGIPPAHLSDVPSNFKTAALMKRFLLKHKDEIGSNDVNFLSRIREHYYRWLRNSDTAKRAQPRPSTELQDCAAVIDLLTNLITSKSQFSFSAAPTPIKKKQEDDDDGDDIRFIPKSTFTSTSSTPAKIKPLSGDLKWPSDSESPSAEDDDNSSSSHSSQSYYGVSPLTAKRNIFDTSPQSSIACSSTDQYPATSTLSSKVKTSHVAFSASPVKRPVFDQTFSLEDLLIESAIKMSLKSNFSATNSTSSAQTSRACSSTDPYPPYKQTSGACSSTDPVPVSNSNVEMDETERLMLEEAIKLSLGQNESLVELDDFSEIDLVIPTYNNVLSLLIKANERNNVLLETKCTEFIHLCMRSMINSTDVEDGILLAHRYDSYNHFRTYVETINWKAVSALCNELHKSGAEVKLSRTISVQVTFKLFPSEDDRLLLRQLNELVRFDLIYGEPNRNYSAAELFANFSNLHEIKYSKFGMSSRKRYNGTELNQRLNLFKMD